MDGNDELAMVKRHVREGRVIVSRQRKLVAKLADAGFETRAAEDLLVSFEAVQAQHCAHLARLTERSSRNSN